MDRELFVAARAAEMGVGVGRFHSVAWQGASGLKRDAEEFFGSSRDVPLLSQRPDSDTAAAVIPTGAPLLRIGSKNVAQAAVAGADQLLRETRRVGRWETLIKLIFWDLSPAFVDFLARGHFEAC